MGTNYYLTFPSRINGDLSTVKLHIGKSSFGWTFALHVIPEKGIRDLPDWVNLWDRVLLRDGAAILNEYDDELTPADMLSIICERTSTSKHKILSVASGQYGPHAIVGSNNLLRSKIDMHHCIGHGTGTWDLITGDFS